MILMVHLCKWRSYKDVAGFRDPDIFAFIFDYERELNNRAFFCKQMNRFRNHIDVSFNKTKRYIRL